jgi:hypothetical protein
VGPRASVDAMAMGKIPCPYQESNSGRPVRSRVILLTELRRLPYWTDTDQNKVSPAALNTDL